MNPKKGICVECGEEKYLANNSKKLCAYHNQVRKRDLKKKKMAEQEDFKSEYEVFLEIWNERPHKSWLSGRDLEKFKPPHTFFVNMFAHVLNKQNWKKMKYDKENIVLLHPEEHDLDHYGTEDSRRKYCEFYECDWGRWEALKASLKEKYKSL